MENSEIILVNINGEDRPGLTAALTEILAKHGAFILDIGQSDIHRNVAIGILFKSMHNNSGEILKDLLFKAYEMEVNVKFTPISAEKYSNWVSMQGKNRYIIRSEEHTSELQSRPHLVCRLLLEKKKIK